MTLEETNNCEIIDELIRQGRSFAMYRNPDMSAKMHGTELSGVKAVPCDVAVLKQKETGR